MVFQVQFSDESDITLVVTSCGRLDLLKRTLESFDHFNTAPYIDIAQAVQANLKDIGIKVNLLPAEKKQVYTKMRARTFQMLLSG